MSLDESAGSGRTPIIVISSIGIAAFIYFALLVAFLTYKWQKEQDKLLRQQIIAKCLDAGGHIGRGLSCREDKPTKELEP
jgi:hypothetical protein